MWVPLTPLDFYRRCSRLFAGKTGVVDGSTRLTFAQFGGRVERLAGALRSAGLRPREVVSVLGPNTHQLLECFYGVPLAGGVVHPVSLRHDPLEVAEILNDGAARTLLVHESAARLVSGILGNLKAVERLVVLDGEPECLGAGATGYEAFLDGAEPWTPDLAALDEDVPCALFHTSGGAARPRGVVLSHRTLALHALYAALAIPLREDDVSLCSVPFAHMNGGGNPQANLALAATSVLARRTDPEELLPLVARERVTVWITAPMVLKRLLRSPLLAGTDVSSLRRVLVGGAPLPEAVVREAEERLGAECVAVYGLTETSPFVTAAVPRRDVPRWESREAQATAGRPILGVEVRIVDEDGREVPWDGGSAGEVLVRGNGVMTRYHHDAEGTQEALRGGWLHTGDLATVSAGGDLRLRGRRSDVILVEGHRVRALEVEAALLSHPDVRECTVIPALDPERGEAPVALVVLGEGARVTEGALLAHLRQRLAPFQIPQRIEFLPSLPRNEAGEILKSELRTVYAR